MARLKITRREARDSSSGAGVTFSRVSVTTKKAGNTTKEVGDTACAVNDRHVGRDIALGTKLLIGYE